MIKNWILKLLGIDKMKYIKKEHLVRNVDSPMGFDFKGYFRV